MKYRLVIMVIIINALLTACTPVKPWERGMLAKPEMAFEADLLAEQLNNHIYFSKEASSGGTSASGGGCGCN